MDNETLQLLYWAAYDEGVRDTRCQCDICPQRHEDGQSVLIPAHDVFRRPGIEN